MNQGNVLKPSVLVKIGGDIIVNDKALHALFSTIASIQNDFRVVLVHGGGGQLDDWMKALEVPIEKIEGLRVCTTQGMEVSAAVLAGLVNKSLVACGLKHSLRCVGMSLCDAGMINAISDNESPLGLVGQPEPGSAEGVELLLDAGFLPIVNSIAVNQYHQLVNVNADQASVSLAQLINAEAIFFITAVSGVYDEEKNILPRLTISQCESLLSSATVAGGMAVKLKSATHAVKSLNKNAVIGDVKSIANCLYGVSAGDDAKSTVIVKD